MAARLRPGGYDKIDVCRFERPGLVCGGGGSDSNDASPPSRLEHGRIGYTEHETECRYAQLEQSLEFTRLDLTQDQLDRLTAAGE